MYFPLWDSNFKTMALLRNAFWIALFAIFTFLFVVLFEYGTTNYVENAKLEYKDMRVFFKLDKTEEEIAQEKEKAAKAAEKAAQQ